MKIAKTLLVSMVLGFGVVLGGCTGNQAAQTEIEASPVVTIKGIVKVSGASILITKDGVTTEITSRKIDLKNYDGKEVEVTGEFSGTTLFVDEVK